MILDEAQRIKNWSTRTARSVKQIPSAYAIVLTGTPLENRLEELVSIVDFIDPFRLGPTYRFLDAHQSKDENGRVTGYRDLDRVTATLASVVLRRRKSEVLSQLPERLEKQFLVAMTPQRRRGAEPAACRGGDQRRPAVEPRKNTSFSPPSRTPAKSDFLKRSTASMACSIVPSAMKFTTRTGWR